MRISFSLHTLLFFADKNIVHLYDYIYIRNILEK